MSRIHWYPLLLMLLVPGTSSALQLRWGSGADTLSFSSATRCVLVLRSDSTEALPSEWRLAWLADSMGVNFVAMDSVTACEADTAMVAALDPPATHADSLARLLTASFCSEAGPSSLVAYYVLDQPGGSRGRFRVVALDPNDPNAETVIQSNEVTCNGGVEGDYAPVLLRAESGHETAELRVKVVGAWLDSAATMRVGAPDDLWSLALSIVQQDSASIEAVADVGTALPEAVVQATTSWGASDVAWLPGEQLASAIVASAGVDTMLYRDPNPSVYPKDFAFHYNSVYELLGSTFRWRGYFHLFYIRNRIAQDTIPAQDSIIAHAWTDSLGRAWRVDTLAFRPSGSGWDGSKVWAPSIQQVGNLTYMFYTGVDANGNQSIGYATTPMLGTSNVTWTRNSTPAYTSSNTGWADQVGHETQGVLAFRDPFVMPDPQFPGRYLLFNTGEDGVRSTHDDPAYTIGVARNSPGTLAQWQDLGNYEATDQDDLPVPGAIESPMVVRDSLTGAWRMFVANARYDDNGYFSTIFLTQSPGDSLTNRAASAWPERDSLYAYLDQDEDVIGWQACEHLQIGHAHFFAGYEGNGIGITRMHWDPEQQKFVIAYPSVAAVGDSPGASDLQFAVSEFKPGSGVVRLSIESVETIVPRLAVYDVSGRRVRSLGAGQPMRGRLEIVWNCRDEAGRRLASGIYFVRLTSERGTRVLRLPVIR